MLLYLVLNDQNWIALVENDLFEASTRKKAAWDCLPSTHQKTSLEVTLHTADSWSMSVPSWSHDFLASKERTAYRLRLRDFRPSRQGKPVPGLALDAAQVPEQTE